MPEKKKRRYPSGRLKLHAMKERLEQEIAERQEMLEEVTRLTRQADNTAIVNTALNFNVTPEEFSMLVKALRSDTLNTEMLAAAMAAGSDPNAVADDEATPEDELDEVEDMDDDEH